MSLSIETLYIERQGFLSQTSALKTDHQVVKQKDVAEWVRAARNAKGWTQQQLADAVGVTKANVSHWETVKHDPSFLQLLRIRDLTGYPLREVLGSDDWPFVSVRKEQLTSLEAGTLAAVEAGIAGILSALAVNQAAPGATVPPEKRAAHG